MSKPTPVCLFFFFKTLLFFFLRSLHTHARSSAQILNSVLRQLLEVENILPFLQIHLHSGERFYFSDKYIANTKFSTQYPVSSSSLLYPAHITKGNFLNLGAKLFKSLEARFRFSYTLAQECHWIMPQKRAVLNL